MLLDLFSSVTVKMYMQPLPRSLLLLHVPSCRAANVTSSHPPCDSGVSLRLGYQVSQQGAGAQETQADVGGLGEVPQHRRVREVFGARPAVDQRHHNLDEAFVEESKNGTVLMTGWVQKPDVPLYLSVLQGEYPWVLGGAQLVIVEHYPAVWLFSKPLDALALWVCRKKVDSMYFILY